MDTRKNVGPIKTTNWHSLPEEILTEIGSYLHTKDLFSLLKSSSTFLLFQSEISQYDLLRAVLDNEKEKVKKILDVRPEFLIQEPKLKEGIESRKTWQRFRAEKPLKLALKRHQPEMVELLIPYFFELEKKGIIKNSQETALKQWNQAAVEMKARPENYDDFLIPLILAISSDNPNEMQRAILAFRKQLLPDEPINLNLYFDIEKFLSVAYLALNTHYGSTLIRTNQYDYFSICVIGFLQSLVNPELAKLFCQGIRYVMDHGCNNISECAASFKVVLEKTPYYRTTRHSKSGLGFTCFVSDPDDGLGTTRGCFLTTEGKILARYIDLYIDLNRIALAQIKGVIETNGCSEFIRKSKIP